MTGIREPNPEDSREAFDMPNIIVPSPAEVSPPRMARAVDAIHPFDIIKQPAQ